MKSSMNLLALMLMSVVLIDQRSTCCAQSYDNQCTKIQSEGSIQDMVGTGNALYSLPTLSNGCSRYLEECLSFEVVYITSNGTYEIIERYGETVNGQYYISPLNNGAVNFFLKNVNDGKILRQGVIIAVVKNVGYAFAFCPSNDGSVITEGYVVGFSGASESDIANMKTKYEGRVPGTTLRKLTGCSDN
ncbi:hypothetical protein CHUAL_000243 [Chamberlinius hualienensis]